MNPESEEATDSRGLRAPESAYDARVQLASPFSPQKRMKRTVNNGQRFRARDVAERAQLPSLSTVKDRSMRPASIALR